MLLLAPYSMPCEVRRLDSDISRWPVVPCSNIAIPINGAVKDQSVDELGGSCTTLLIRDRDYSIAIMKIWMWWHGFLTRRLCSLARALDWLFLLFLC